MKLWCADVNSGITPAMLCVQILKVLHGMKSQICSGTMVEWSFIDCQSKLDARHNLADHCIRALLTL